MQRGDGERKVLRSQANLLQRGKSEGEDLLHVGDVGARDAVAIGGERHRFAQPERGRRGDILLGRAAEAAGARAADGLVDVGGVGGIERGEYAAQAPAQVRAGLGL